jgi:flagellin
MISIQTNIDSLNAQANMNVNHTAQSKTIQQLTSGYRINSSADDAAGLAIANSYRSNVNELSQGVRNANDGISQLQIVDGGLSNVSNILDRMKTLATQSASGTFTGSRSVLDQEFQNLATEITRQATNIQLNSGGALNSSLSIYIGGGTGSTVTVDLSGATNQVDAAGLGITASTKLDTAANATTAIASINSALTALGKVQGTVGAGQNTLNYAVGLAQSQISNFSAAESQIRDADVAADAANLSKSQVLMQTSVAAMAQANQESQSVLKLLQG